MLQHTDIEPSILFVRGNSSAACLLFVVFQERELLMKTKFDGMLARCNSESVPVGERLYCGVSFLLCLLSQYLRLRETAEGLNREARKFERQLSGVLHNGNSRSDSLLSELLGVTSTPSAALLKQIGRAHV